jgi:glycyl-tRNA synthetase beta chain
MTPVDAFARARAIARIPREAREVFKRVANILDEARKQGITPGAAPEPARFVHATETGLHAAVAAARDREAPLRERGDYAALFDSLVALQPTVAALFDKGGVMVMDPDPALRDNRLALLHWLVAPYMAIADFRKLG